MNRTIVRRARRLDILPRLGDRQCRNIFQPASATSILQLVICMISVQIFCPLDKMRRQIKFSHWQRMFDQSHNSCLRCPGINHYLSTLKPSRSASSFSEDGQSESANVGRLEPVANFFKCPRPFLHIRCRGCLAVNAPRGISYARRWIVGWGRV